MPTLPSMIYQTYGESLQAAVDRTWGAALTLILIIFLLNIARPLRRPVQQGAELTTPRTRHTPELLTPERNDTAHGQAH